MGEFVGRVAALWRYPVKSMLGERRGSLDISSFGVAGDRRYALIDNETGRVATAKLPRLWRRLLQCVAVTEADEVVVTLPDGRTLAVTESAGPLSELLGRLVSVADQRPHGATVERSDPDEVLARGIDVETEFALLEIGQGAPGSAFVDHSPVHVITTATLGAIGVGVHEAMRYRPNIVIETPDECPPFVENDWLGTDLGVGAVALRATMPTPRCSVPTLEHGALGRSPRSVRHVAEHNRVEVPGFGVLPCAGVYAAVRTEGTVNEGDEVRLTRPT